MGEWTAFRGEDPGGQIFWKARGPLTKYTFVTPVFQSLAEISGALVKLAMGLKLAFRVSAEDLAKSRERYGRVFMAKGDRRAAHLAGKPENAHEVDGLPYGTVLLFDQEFAEDNGRISERQLDFLRHGAAREFGVSIWGRFYAIEIDQPSFDRDPRIPA
jgi:hypothetical protein